MSPSTIYGKGMNTSPENKTRSITLIRLAINLGFSAGPAVGGLIIVSLSYGALFWIDGITCALAGLLLLKVLHPKKTKTLDSIEIKNPKSAYRDVPYIIFLLSMVLFGVAFLQYFSTIPLYYKDVHMLSEDKIGLIMAMNGILICIIEMPLVKWLEDSSFKIISLILFGGILTALSFIVLNLTGWVGILIIGMLLMTIGEMISFPFSNAFAMQRAKRGNQGEYMALYSITFALSHIIGHNSGMQLIDNFGFDFTWNVMTIVMIVSIFILVILKKSLSREKQL